MLGGAACLLLALLLPARPATASSPAEKEMPPELQEEFAYNAETQKALVRNGETLLGKILLS